MLRPIVGFVFSLAMCLPISLLPQPVSAQGAPPIYLDNIRRQQGDAIRACVDDAAVGAPFDRAVAQAIGDALLLEVRFDRAPGGFPVNGGGYFEELQIRMNKFCDVVMGMSLQAGNPYPDWVTATRAYVTEPFVLAVIDPVYDSLKDIPYDRLIGTALGSSGEWAFISTMQQRRESERWRRLPYADPELMLQRLQDGRLAGMVLWQPSLARLLRDRSDSPPIRVIAPAPVPVASVRVGGLVSSRDSFLRSQIDAAIEELVANGTIAALMTDFGYTGQPGG